MMFLLFTIVPAEFVCALAICLAVTLAALLFPWAKTFSGGIKKPHSLTNDDLSKTQCTPSGSPAENGPAQIPKADFTQALPEDLYKDTLKSCLTLPQRPDFGYCDYYPLKKELFVDPVWRNFIGCNSEDRREQLSFYWNGIHPEFRDQVRKE
ncbi:MAG: hypothetical protein P4M02_06150, partial [Clostridia bacterium]|nr:hypothetical protein [Clostridia bacterium]